MIEQVCAMEDSRTGIDIEAHWAWLVVCLSRMRSVDCIWSGLGLEEHGCLGGLTKRITHGSSVAVPGHWLKRDTCSGMDYPGLGNSNLVHAFTSLNDR